MKDHIKKFFYDFMILPVWKLFDFVLPKKNAYWAFSVHHIKSDQFIENQRAVFEAIKNNLAIKKIIFTRTEDKSFSIDGAVNFEIVKLYSLTGLFLFAQCRVLFITHSIAMDYSKRYGKKLFSPIKPWLKKRVIVNLWHGIPLKRLLALANQEVRERTDRSAFRRKERHFYSGLVTSSDIDSYAMATMFYPIKYENIWITGLPKNDFLLQQQTSLPKYMMQSLNEIDLIKKGRKLVLYAPTYRQTSLSSAEGYYCFSLQEIVELKKLLKENKAILGLRMHYFRNDSAVDMIEKMIDNEFIFDLGHSKFQEIGMVLRATDYLITDYSSVYMDALYLNKPVFSFAYDLENYKIMQDGLLYDMDIAFPGPVVTRFRELLDALHAEMVKPSQIEQERYKMIRKMFYQYVDANNASRVVQYINNITEKRWK